MRKKNESIIINEEIELEIVEIKGKTVKLGFKFPKGCSVLRKELFERIKSESESPNSGLPNLSLNLKNKDET